MSVAMRVQHLLDKHGDSLRQAEERTGVSRETIRRIINGYEGATLVHHVQAIARGYGLEEQSLLEGLDPKGDFEWTIHQAPPSQRLEFLMMTFQDRVKLTWDFLLARYPKVVTLELTATASGLECRQLASLLTRWESVIPDRKTTSSIAMALHRITGISLPWFELGWVGSEPAARSITLRAGQLLCASAARSTRHTASRTQQLLRVMSQDLA